MLLDEIVSRGRGTPPSSFQEVTNGQSGSVQEMMIPAGKAGLIIGKGGETIKQLQVRSQRNVPDSVCKGQFTPPQQCLTNTKYSTFGFRMFGKITVIFTLPQQTPTGMSVTVWWDTISYQTNGTKPLVFSRAVGTGRVCVVPASIATAILN